jgi:flagellar biosynthesis GTPase FlhF
MKQEIVASPSSMLLSDKIESLDFSFPSYSEATGSVTIKDIPKFSNPFGSSESDDSDKADKKAAADAAKEDARAEKAAAADRKAEEKAAAEAKRAEEKAAAEQAKADKAARREEQLAKQKAAVERSTKREVEEEKVRV